VAQTNGLYGGKPKFSRSERGDVVPATANARTRSPHRRGWRLLVAQLPTWDPEIMSLLSRESIDALVAERMLLQPAAAL
jgi:hypothetical protein